MDKFKIGDIVRIISNHKWDEKKLKEGLSPESSRILEVDLHSKIEYSFRDISFEILNKSVHIDNFIIQNKELGIRFSIHYKLLEPHLSEKITKILNV